MLRRENHLSSTPIINELERILVAAMVRYVEDHKIKPEDITYFEFYYDETLRRQRRRGWYAFATHQSPNTESNTFGSAIDVRVDALVAHNEMELLDVLKVANNMKQRFADYLTNPHVYREEYLRGVPQSFWDALELPSPCGYIPQVAYDPDYAQAENNQK
jgi:hypothetical protein